VLNCCALGWFPPYEGLFSDGHSNGLVGSRHTRSRFFESTVLADLSGGSQDRQGSRQIQTGPLPQTLNPPRRHFDFFDFAVYYFLQVGVVAGLRVRRCFAILGCSCLWKVNLKAVD
jgi:hypothetical protein